MKLQDWLDADDTRTQAKLALAVGCSQETISRIANGGSCSVTTMRAIHEATDGEVTPNDLVLGEAE